MVDPGGEACREQAQRARLEAEGTRDPARKQAFLRIAKEWDDLALKISAAGKSDGSPSPGGAAGGGPERPHV
jgi:hypothetical protein